MAENLDVVVAQYGHARLAGAKHWAIIILTSRELSKGIAFQVTGSTNTYKVKQPEEVELFNSNTYMGHIEIGTVHRDGAFGVEDTALRTIIQNTPIVRGDLNWNCQNWVVDALQRLKNAQHNILDASVKGLQDQFAQVQRDDMS